MATVTSSRKLLIKNLPPELEDEDKIDLLRHFEAVEVVAFGRRGSMVSHAWYFNALIIISISDRD